MRLRGKIAFVTGAGGGIGRAVCARFLAEGARVAAVDIDIAAARRAIETRATAGDAIALAGDAGDSDSMRDAIAIARRSFGGLNVLCPFAGGSSAQDGPVTTVDEAEFWRVIRVDLFGPFVCCKHGLPHLIAAGGGSVIAMTSMMAVTGVPNRDCYTAAKGGVVAITRSMAIEYAPHKVRVNAIAPGVTLTPRVKARIAADAGVRAVAERHPLGPAEPEDIADLAVYLASDESRVVTGQILSIDGGATI